MISSNINKTKALFLRVLGLCLIISVVLPVFTPVMINNLFLYQVAASEEEETDDFNVLPNYRWNNETTTNSDVSETNQAGYYTVINSNTDVSGSSKLEKSRHLNGRDVNLEGRIQPEIASSFEYFEDVLKDPCDFSEDNEGFTGDEIDLSNGILTVQDTDYVNFNFDLSTYHEIDESLVHYYTVFVRIRTLEGSFSLIVRDGDDPNIDTVGTVTSEWQTISKTFVEGVDVGANDVLDSLNFYMYVKTATVTAYIDYVKLERSVIDFAYSEGDAWDFEEGDQEGLIEEHTGFIDVDNGLLNLTDYDGGDTRSHYEWDITNFNLNDISNLTVHVDSNNLVSCGFDILVFDDTADFIYLTQGNNTSTENVLEEGDNVFIIDDEKDQLDSDIIDKIRIYIIDNSLNGSGSLFIDYITLTYNWRSETGCKISLLNSVHEEGVSLEFLRGNTSDSNNYSFKISFYDSTGISDSSTTFFNYDPSDDGFLYFKFDYHIDKKKTKLLLEYENQTEIVDAKNLYSLVGILSRSSNLIDKIGFPLVCLNLSQDYLCKSSLTIDFIDANYEKMDFRLLDWDSDIPITFMGITAQDNENDQYREDALSVDKFDFLSFEVDLSMSDDLDTAAPTIVPVYITKDDYIYYHFEFYPVFINGCISDVPLFNVFLWGHRNYPSDTSETAIEVYVNRDKQSGTFPAGAAFSGDFTEEYSNSYEMSAKFSVARESNDSFVLSIALDTDVSTEIPLTYSYNQSEVLYSREVYIKSSIYHNDKTTSGNDDDFAIVLSSFTVIRKDIFSGLVKHLQNIFSDVVGLLVLPFIAGFEFLGYIIKIGNEALGNLIIPALEALGDFIVGGLGAILDTITSVLGDIWDELVDLPGAIFGFFEDVLDSIIDLIQGIVQLLIDGSQALIEALVEGLIYWVDLIITFFSNLLFDWYDSILIDGQPAPNILAMVEAVFGFIIMLFDVILSTLGGIVNLLQLAPEFLLLFIFLYWLYTFGKPAIISENFIDWFFNLIGELLQQKINLHFIIFGARIYFAPIMIVITFIGLGTI